MGDPFASDVVRNGLRIGLNSLPWQTRIARLAMPPVEESAIWEEVLALLRKRAVKRMPFTQRFPAPRTFVSSIFCVPKRDGGLRPCLNLRPFNEFVTKRHFKLESLTTVYTLLRKNDFMTKIDIKDAYLHIPIAREHQPFLRFNFRETTYQFLVLCFGLTTAPWAFSRLMKPLVARLRAEGIRLVIYLDDILIMAESEELCRQHTRRVVLTLTQFGWIINWKKSETTPSRVRTYLGVSIDSTRMAASLTEERLRRLSIAVEDMLMANNSGSLTLRAAAKTLGQMSAAAVGISIARLKERPLLNVLRQALASGLGWEDKVSLDLLTVQACGWWLDQFRQWNGVALIPGTPSMTLTTDASEEAQGCTLRTAQLDLRTQFIVPVAQRSRSSNWRELMAILLALERFAAILRGQTLLIRSDNTTALACIRNQGSREAELNEIAERIWTIALAADVRLLVEYVPGEQNAEADRLSRWTVHDVTGWQLHPAVFARILDRWGPLSIDLFASETNRLLPRFFSWIYSAQAEGIDCFRHRWPPRAFAHPTPSLVGRVLRKAIVEQVRDLILVAPLWRSAPWWPLLLELAQEPPMIISRRQDFLLPCGRSLPPPEFHKWTWAAWRLSATSGPSGA